MNSGGSLCPALLHGLGILQGQFSVPRSALMSDDRCIVHCPPANLQDTWQEFDSIVNSILEVTWYLIELVSYCLGFIIITGLKTLHVTFYTS